MYQPGGIQYTRKELLQNARENFRRIKSIFGRRVDIAVENNNYYPTEAYQWVSDADFISELVFENEIFFLFDIAHAKITAHNKRINYRDYARDLPLDKTIQIHISGFSIDQYDLAFDAHDPPQEAEWAELKKFLSEKTRVKYLTIECYEDKHALIESLKKARNIVNELSGSVI
jgi:uncharacterized protein (UPF0276 family)